MRSGLVKLVSDARWDVVIVGGGASGLLCAIYAGRKGRRVLVLEQSPKCGLKILVSGGGRCNFTNTWTDPKEHFLSANAHFCISALRRYTPWDFIALVEDNGIGYHEKKLGQQWMHVMPPAQQFFPSRPSSCHFLRACTTSWTSLPSKWL